MDEGVEYIYTCILDKDNTKVNILQKNNSIRINEFHQGDIFKSRLEISDYYIKIIGIDQINEHGLKKLK